MRSGFGRGKTARLELRGGYLKAQVQRHVETAYPYVVLTRERSHRPYTIGKIVFRDHGARRGRGGEGRVLC